MEGNQDIREAKRNGKAEGEKIGEKRAKLETAKKMFEEDITLETIIKITGLTKEEVLKEDSIKGLEKPLEECTTEEEAKW